MASLVTRLKKVEILAAAMGEGIRIFLVNEDETLRRIPVAKYDRLLGGDTDVYFQEYAGKRVRYVFIILKFIKRMPVEIISIQYSILSFDPNGRIDFGDLEKEMELGFQMLSPSCSDPVFPNVIHAEDRFALKRFYDRYTWEPNSKIEKAIANAIFPKGLR